MYVGMLMMRVYDTYNGDIKFENLTHVSRNTGGEGVGYLQ